MPVRVQSSGVLGVDAHAIDVEVDISRGAYGYETVGLPDTAVRESRQRVKAAIRNCGYRFPAERVIVNLSPADVRKEGTVFDLPIAVGIVAASKQANLTVEETLVIGELGLGGAVRPVRGALAMVLGAHERGVRRVVVPYANAAEAAAVPGMEVIGARTLVEAVQTLEGRLQPVPPPQPALRPTLPSATVDLSFVRGQSQAKEALTIAAAGGHHLLLSGPPGTGKTLLARCLRELLPEPTLAERMEVSRVHSVAGLLSSGGLLSRRPFRAPHHTASSAAIIGGGSGIPRPGEVSLAHLGVLFMDELPEFQRSVREVLREPLESGEVIIARARSTVRLPARFQLVATMNPCPCGFRGTKDPNNPCSCTEAAVSRYEARLSGPIRDRFDLHAFCPRVPRQLLLSDSGDRATSEEVRVRVSEARDRQRRRLGGTAYRSNAEIHGDVLEELCRFTPPTRKLVGQVMDATGLSARGLHRAVRVARTIADLDAARDLLPTHMARALRYRQPGIDQVP